MPAVSQAQRGFLNATKGHGWVKEHGFDNKGKLPAHVKPKKKQPAGIQLKAVDYDNNGQMPPHMRG